MTIKEIKDKYHAKKNNILNNERLTETEKDIARYKNWCAYVQEYVNCKKGVELIHS
jgi:glutaredoxin-related protein